MALLHGKDYHQKFKASQYLENRYSNPSRDFLPALRWYHETFQALPHGLRVLDYGTGPVILTTISAATKASEIVLSDYTQDNRDALRSWLERRPDAYDWSPHFIRVVRELEGKGEEELEEEAEGRQELVRRLVKGVVHCDLTEDPPIQPGYDQEYDVVISCLCLEVVAQTYLEYKQQVVKLARLVKPGGLILIRGATILSGPHVYTVADLTFGAFSVTPEQAAEAFSDAGVEVIVCEKMTDLSLTVGSQWSHFVLKGIRRK